MNIGKWLIITGFIIVIVGAIIWLGNKWGLPFGKLPGDLSIKKENYSFNFPIVTSIIVSIVLTIIINVILWIFRK